MPSIVIVSPVVVAKSVGSSEADGSGRGRLAEAAVDLALRALGQQIAVHVARAAAHRVAGDDVFADRGFGEVVGRKNFDLAGVDGLLRDDAAHAAEVVDVAMGVDDGDDRLVAELRDDEFTPHGRRAFGGNEWVDDDVAGVRAENSHHRKVVAARLPDAVHDFEEAVDHVELGDAPEARIDGVRRVVLFGDVDEGVLAQVPDRSALGVADDDRLGERGDQASPRVLEVLIDAKRQALPIERV